MDKELFRVKISIAIWVILCFPGFTIGSNFSNLRLDGPPFSVDPADLLRHAGSVTRPEGADILVLRQETQLEFRPDGSCDTRRHLIYLILTETGMQQWAEVTANWKPWYQSRPTLMARVITPDGNIHLLDPSTISEASAQSKANNLYINVKTLQAPLPALSEGAIVEELVTTSEERPFFDRGVVRKHYIGNTAPVIDWTLSVRAPTSLPIKHTCQLCPTVQSTRSESSGVVEYSWKTGPVEPWESVAAFLAPDHPRLPYVAFTTGETWGTVAKGYLEIVEEAIGDTSALQIFDDIQPGGSEEGKIKLALTNLHQRVRYTGIEFDESSYIPKSPAETLETGYGDCKDKATLLVAMLRSLGVPSNVALVRTGWGRDVDFELPGLGTFDHVIVHVPGHLDLWIDPTAEYHRPGILPLETQGRYALILAEDTKELVSTPRSSSTDNRIIEERKFILSDYGPAKVIETTQVYGTIEAGYRATYAGGLTDSINESFKSYIADTYLSENVERIDLGKAHDFSEPYRLQLEMSECSRGFTDIGQAVVAIPIFQFFERLPSEMSFERVDALEKRTKDLLVPEPYSTQWSYEIVSPDGFEVAQVPEPIEVQLGPSIFRSNFSVEEPNIIRGKLEFDTVRQRFSPAEIVQFRTALDLLLEKEPLLVLFDQVGEADLGEGKISEALKEFRRLLDAYPTSPLPYTRLARGLLAAGLGYQARDISRKTIELFPEASIGYETLGSVLEHDLLGRRFHAGFDYEGAVAAYRKAIELDPDDNSIKIDLAVVLEWNPSGVRFGPGSNVGEAEEIYREYLEQEADTVILENLAIALFNTNQFHKLRDLLRQTDSKNETLKALEIAATTVMEGAEAGIRHAFRITGDSEESRSALLTAGSSLLLQRRYPEAVELMTRGAKGMPNAASIISEVSLYRQTRKWEDLHYPDDDPRSLFFKFFIAILADDSWEEEFHELLSIHSLSQLSEEEVTQGLHKPIRVLRQNLQRIGLPPQVVLDLVVSLARLSLEGNDEVGYRILVDLPFPQSKRGEFYVLLEEGQYRLLDFNEFSSGGSTLALEVLDRVEAGKLGPAGKLLTWVRESRTLTSSEDPLSGDPFARVWSKTNEGLELETRLAAGVLLSGSESSAQTAVAVLKELKDQVPEEDRLPLNLAVARAYKKLSDYQGYLKYTSLLYDAHPDSEIAFVLLTDALGLLERWKDLEKIILEKRSANPNSFPALRAECAMAQSRGEHVQAWELGQKLIDLGEARPEDMNNIAWSALFLSEFDQRAVDIIERALVQAKAPERIHTGSAVYAEIGRITEARELLLEYMFLEGLDEPDSASWYVLGRIAEQLGEIDAATSAFEHVKKPDKSTASFSSSYVLAQNRLKTIRYK
jgi:tetratricopeptide (TPR) repeat protein